VDGEGISVVEPLCGKPVAGVRTWRVPSSKVTVRLSQVRVVTVPVWLVT
jgi:hypothetical protein